MQIIFPEKFPTTEEMHTALKWTIETSWGNNIGDDEINLWLDNFIGEIYNKEDEKRIALWLLCNFTFFSHEEINHLCEVMFKKFIHDLILCENVSSDSLSELLDRTLFAAIGSASESGGLLLYHFRQASGLQMSNFCYPTAFNSSEENILVCVDDVTLSGGTAKKHYYKILQEEPARHKYYLTIVANKKAVDALKSLGIKVIYANLVDERDGCFSDTSMLFHKYPNLKEPAKRICEHYGKKIKTGKSSELGFKNAGFAFGFYYNTPNNTLPIFWSEQDWTPIFPRKEKIYNEKYTAFKQTKYI